jgi:2-polyprenyl-6-methoxyphenol hydroxylase-like FAD-dependent oxidoreductase
MNQSIQTRCCVAGGGPAGMMTAFLLARMGVDVVLLEKHGDFLRDFRGDTIHASTLQLMHELGLLEEFLKLPHQEIRELSAQVGQETVTIADFTHVPTYCKFVALMPQWDFLDFLKQHAERYREFHLRMETEAVDLIIEGDTVAGVRAKTKDGLLEIRADLTIAADGRHSIVRERAGMEKIDLGAPMDVMWMRLSRHREDPAQTFGHADQGKILVLLNRETYWQVALVIPKGEAEEIKQKGLEAFCGQIASLEPFLRNRVRELCDWNQVSLLTVKVDRLKQWSRRGLLCIGDAAHAMSPIGGVGINLAIQDAVATANLLGGILIERVPTQEELQRVQRRRTFPTRATQGLQLAIQNNIIRRVLGKQSALSLPWPLKLLRHWKALRRIPARVVGVGFRPEHIRTPDVHSPQ